MNNSDVYNLQPKTIQELINEASKGAICIPNIQRPYVWEPHQLANLVDSLIHGWPCGNLLFWKVSPEQKFFGARRFTKEIRSKECDDVSTPSEDTDNLQYTDLVLDGQQRIQSLVIAFAKDSAGFTATPKEWKADVGGSGGAIYGTIQKWLCFDFTNWEEEKIASNPSFYYRDHDNSESLPMLKWATKEEIENSAGTLVKLSEIKEVQNPSKEVRWLQDKVEKVFNLEMPTITVTHEVKGTNEDEAIVQIFTRLNTAGTPLTREEILSAKIKQNWKEFLQKLEQLQMDLENNFRMDVDNSDLVTGFNALIKAKTKETDIYAAYRKMGTEEKAWSNLWNNFYTLATSLIGRLVNDFHVHYKKEYQSLHAIWFILALQYRCCNSASPDSAPWKENLMHLIIKWLMLGNWSKVWANRSNGTVSYLTKEIASNEINSYDMDNILHRWINDETTLKMKTFAKDNLNVLRASARGSVRIYYHYLWVWMRQTPERAKLLAKFSPAGQALDVDHILPADWVKNSPVHFHTLNRLGNCWLLGNKTNIRKKDKDFTTFLQDNDSKELDIPHIIDAVELSQYQRGNASDETWDEAISHEIERREDSIKNDLINYIDSEDNDKICLYYVPAIDTDDIYLGDNFLQCIRSEPKRKQDDYIRGIRFAYNKLKSRNEGNQIFEKLKSSSKENTVALTESEWDVLSNLNLNTTYRAGWNAYLDFISGKSKALRQEDQPQSEAPRRRHMTIRDNEGQHQNDVALPIGKLAQSILREKLPLIPLEEAERFTTQPYSKQVFNLSFPLLCRERIPGTEISIRYYMEPIVIHGETFYLTSQWVEKRNHRSALLSWNERHKDINTSR